MTTPRKEQAVTGQYTIRGNRTLTVMSAHDANGFAEDDDHAFAIAVNVAHQWGESVTVLRPDGSMVCWVRPDRGLR